MRAELSLRMKRAENVTNSIYVYDKFLHTDLKRKTVFS